MTSFGPPSPSTSGDTEFEGFSQAPARSDHRHGRSADAAAAATAAALAAPAGAVTAFAGSAAPAGWLLCDGSAVSRTTYANLFAVTGTTYGAGDGSTTFNLPDLRGRVVAAVDGGAGRITSSNTLGAASGTQAHTHTSAAHTHTSAAHTHGVSATHSHASAAHSHTLSSTGSALITFSTSAATMWMKVATPSWNADRKAATGGVGVADTTALSTAAALAGSTDSATPGSTGSSAPGSTDSATPADTGSTTPGATGSTSNLQPYLVLNYIIRTG